MTPIDRAILLRSANSARAEAAQFTPHFPRLGMELRRIAEGIEAVLRNTERDERAQARRSAFAVVGAGL